MLASLMSARRFAPLFWCQFFSAFNDNFIKQSLIILVLFGIGTTKAIEHGGSLVTLSTALLVLPGLFLSGLAGQLADRYDKSVVAKRIKFAEIFLILIAAIGLGLHSAPVLLACIFGLGVMSALFGPIKYGILPDHLVTEELPAGNALIEAGTFLSILLGIISCGYALTYLDERIVAAIMVAIAIVCWLSARAIPRTGEAAPQLIVEKNILASTYHLIKSLIADKRLLSGVVVVSWFWMVGAIILSLMATLVTETIHGDQAVNSFFLAAFSVGIALGSVLAARLSAGRIILVIAPIACLMMGLFGLDIAWIAGHFQAAGPVGLGGFLADLGNYRLLADLILLAMAGGLLVVPVFAAVQAWAPKDQRARVIGASNVMSALFMAAGTLIVAALQASGVTTTWLLFGLAVLNLLAGLAFFRILPMSPARDFILLLYRLFFRLEVKGIEHLETPSPNRIIAINHVSFLDAGLMLALLDKDPVFAIDHTIAKAWWVKPFLKIARTFALDPTKPMATRSLINAVKGGDTLVIFPEGRLTVTGTLMKVYDGAGLIADKSQAEIVPVRIDGLERSRFTYLSAKQVSKRWFPKVSVTFTEPVRLAVDQNLVGKKRRQAAGAALYDVMSDLFFKTTPVDRSLFEAFTAAAEQFRKNRVILEDPITGQLTYKKALIGMAVLGRKFEAFTARGEHVGVLLPNANAVALTFFALQSIGRVPAMLNYTGGANNMLAACKAAEVRTILASRTFVEKARLGEAVKQLEQTIKIVWLEDLRTTVTRGDKLRGLFTAGKQRVKVSADEPAAILFTSGSEGTPKGVVLSHRNILSNCAQVAARIDFGPGDILFNVLPVFHSFGMTGGMVLPLISGVRCYLYPSPLHYRIIPELIYGVNATILFGTDTFLAGYAKTAHPYDFRSLRYVLAGAEPVKAETRRIYSEKFGVRILEGYGITETAPVLAVNTPMFNRSGSVGRILPGIESRLEDVPGIEEGGRLFVRGPNVMKGYLRAENPGKLELLPEGWHDTGDIVTVDPQGYVAIKGRAKRFAKVAGEMVSLTAAENMLADLWPENPLAIVSVPDERKGERLLAFTTRAGATRADLIAHLKRKQAPDLMAPAEVIVVDALPVLGSGKTDYVSLNRAARAQAAVAA